MPLTALVVYLIAEAAFRHRQCSERQARVFAWLVTLGMWELATSVAWTSGQFAPAPINAVLGYSAGIFLVLSLFARHTKATDPIKRGHEFDEAWP